MFPKAKHCPTPGGQLRIGSTISPNVRLKLLRPPLAVGPGPCRMLRATMPEASVDENDKPQRPPYDVRLTSEAGLRPHIDAIPHPTRMKKLPHQHLGLRVAAPLPAHPRTN